MPHSKTQTNKQTKKTNPKPTKQTNKKLHNKPKYEGKRAKFDISYLSIADIPERTAYS